MLRVIIISFLSTHAFGQFLENPSFEGAPQSALVPPGWQACNEYSTPDTQPGSWEVSTAPSQGHTYISLFTRGVRGSYDDGYTEAIGTRLKKPFDPQSCYIFSLDLAFFKDARFYDSWGDVYTYENPVILKVWGGSAACGKEVLLFQSIPISNAAWQTHTFSVNPEIQLTHLTLEADFATPQVSFGSVLVDNIRIESLAIDLGPDLVICEGTPVPLTVSVSDAHVEWNTGSTASNITAENDGVYSVTVEKAGCALYDTITIKYAEPIDLALGRDTTLCVGDTLRLSVEVPQGNYRWNTGSVSPAVTVSAEGNYHVIVDNGCYQSEDDINVYVASECCSLFAPNIFTPNGDAFNDAFEMSSSPNLAKFHLTIYNRWGQIVYESADITHLWDGNLVNSKQAASGVYYWTSTISCVRKSRIFNNTIRGSLTLVR